MATGIVIASDQRERGNLENNNFHNIFCYFFAIFSWVATSGLRPSSQ
ncbi:hypothetical protein [Rickettsia endosymbiont of Orchestes rusci]